MINRKIITVIGCTILQFVAGTIYCTGSIMPYVASYVGKESEYSAISSFTMIFYINSFCWSVSFTLASYLQRRYTPKKPVYLGVFLYILVVYVSSSLKTRRSFIAIYGVLLGVASGFVYAPTTFIAINCYPEKKGLISGIVTGGFAFGSFVFNFVALGLVNPNNESPNIEKEINGKTEKFFSDDIADKVPPMFLILASIYAALFIPTLFMVKDVEKVSKKPSVADESGVQSGLTPGFDNSKSVIGNNELEEGEENENKVEGKPDDESIKNDPDDGDAKENSKLELIEQETNQTKKSSFKRVETFIVNLDLHLDFKTSIKTRQFYQIFFASLLTGTSCMYAIASYKSLGLELGYDDGFLTIVGSIGSVFNCFTRPLWGLLFDKKSYKFTYGVICLIQIILCSSFPSIKNEKATFLIWICLLFATSGGIFTQFAPIAVRIYGREVGAQIYGFFVISMGTACLIVYFIQTYAIPLITSTTFYYILAGFSGISFISNLFFSEIIKL